MTNKLFKVSKLVKAEDSTDAIVKFAWFVTRDRDSLGNSLEVEELKSPKRKTYRFYIDVEGWNEREARSYIDSVLHKSLPKSLNVQEVQ